jgi:acyl carrier protein
MDKRELCERVLQIVSRNFDVDRRNISLKSVFVDEPLDGAELDQAPFIEALEQEFRIKFPSEREFKIETIGDCVKYVRRVMHVEGIDQYVDDILSSRSTS